VSNLLITGGAGFIGVNLVKWWLNNHQGDHIVILDALTYAGNAKSLEDVLGHPGVTFVQGDIKDTLLVESLLRDHQLNLLIHLAAESHVDRSIEGPDQFIDTNVIGTHSLLKAARTVWFESGRWMKHRFHHVSTDEVYGSLGTHDPAFSEVTPYAPNSPYSASKAASDHLVRAYHHTFGMEVSTTNCSNNYGAYQFPEKLIPLILTNILAGKPLPIYGDGMNVRDWLHVTDHCRGIDLAISKGRVGETYCIGGRNEAPNLDIVHALCRQIDERFRENPELSKRFPNCPSANGSENTSLITYVTDRPGHDRRYAIDPTKASNELGYEPLMTFESGMSETVDWYLGNQEWWESVMDGSYRNWIETNYQDRS
jgi:dTDP-glucose 4,6-dehydratase